MTSSVFNEEMNETFNTLPASRAGGYDGSPSSKQSYWDIFEDWTDEQFRSAMKQCRAELSWFPVPNQIIQRKYSLKAVNRVYVDQVTYKCLDCRDRGGVEVYDPRCYQPARDGMLTTSNIRTLMVACQCEAGQILQKPPEPSEKNRCRAMPEYDELQMRQVKAVLPRGQVDELIDFVTTVWKPRNHHVEFDDWTR